MKDWLVGIFSASLLSAMAMALCPRGRVRPVLRMVCGVVCALAVAGPLLRLDMESLASSMAEAARQARIVTEGAEEEEKMLERTYIEERYAAYILAKGVALGTDLEAAAVRARWDDKALLWYPWEASLTGTWDRALADAVEGDLGIPAERQHWSGGHG